MPTLPVGPTASLMSSIATDGDKAALYPGQSTTRVVEAERMYRRGAGVGQPIEKGSHGVVQHGPAVGSHQGVTVARIGPDASLPPPFRSPQPLDREQPRGSRRLHGRAAFCAELAECVNNR